MACKDCVCYVDGHSKSGAKVPTGKGLCTMHNQDVVADGSCNSCASVNNKGNGMNRSVSAAQQNSIYGNTATKQPPRRGMKAWATVCFVFAGIYALVALGVGAMMFGMTAFFAVLGIMLTVLSKSPKSNPYLLGKQSGMTKTTFVIICVAIAFCSFGLIAGSSGEVETSSNSETVSPSVGEESKSNVTSIADFKTTEYEMLVGESLDFTVELRPKDLKIV